MKINRHTIENDDINNITISLPYSKFDIVKVISEYNEHGSVIPTVYVKCVSGNEKNKVLVKICLIPITFPIVIDTTSKITFIEQEEIDTENEINTE